MEENWRKRQFLAESANFCCESAKVYENKLNSACSRWTFVFPSFLLTAFDSETTRKQVERSFSPDLAYSAPCFMYKNSFIELSNLISPHFYDFYFSRFSANYDLRPEMLTAQSFN
jgi:hypothetical protein